MPEIQLLSMDEPTVIEINMDDDTILRPYDRENARTTTNDMDYMSPERNSSIFPIRQSNPLSQSQRRSESSSPCKLMIKTLDGSFLAPTESESPSRVPRIKMPSLIKNSSSPTKRGSRHNYGERTKTNGGNIGRMSKISEEKENTSTGLSTTYRSRFNPSRIDLDTLNDCLRSKGSISITSKA